MKFKIEPVDLAGGYTAYKWFCETNDGYKLDGHARSWRSAHRQVKRHLRDLRRVIREIDNAS